MYVLSKKNRFIRDKNVNYPWQYKMKFKLMTKCTSKYLIAPRIYRSRGSAPWDSQRVDVHILPTLLEYVKAIYKGYTEYQDLLQKK